MKGEQQQIKQAAEDVGANIHQAHKETIKAAMEKAKQGTTPKDALGLTDAMVEGIYGQAYRLYNTGKYKEAAQIFRLLLMINATEPKYVMGLAACFHMKKEFQSAIGAYSMVSVLDPNSPVSFYHTADCYIQMGDPVSALIALEAAIKRSEDKPEFKTLKDRAALMVESLKKDIAKAQT